MSRVSRRGLAAGLFLAVSLTLLSCASPHPQTVFDARSDFAGQIQNLFVLIIVLATIVFVVVEGLLIFAVVRFGRRRPEERGLPAQVHGNTRLEIAWTIVPVLILAAIAVPTVRTIFATAAAAPADSLRLRVVGHQWWWEIQYPELGVVTANEIVIPLGQTVNVDLESADVIHSFWVPKMGGKRDAIPNHVNSLWFKPDTPGEYLGQCAEFCGTAHANMRLRLFVVATDEFQTWVRAQRQPATTPADPLAARGAELFARGACVGCHTVDGTNAKGKAGPNLTHFGNRATLAAGIAPNTRENLERWLADPPAFKPGSLMPNLRLSQDDVQALAAYLQSLK
ncbi:MAG: cytochrome c oxidase subunit II [Chloroflexi bacterium]|nr:cytochrome c oxidase subunit II [Chloroflexota bacterium]